MNIAKLYKIAIKIQDQIVYKGCVYALDEEQAKEIVRNNIIIGIIKEEQL